MPQIFTHFSASRSHQSGFRVQLLAGLALPISFYRFGASYRDLNPVWNLHGDFSSRTRYNITPSQEVSVIIRNETRNEAKLMKWGLVPSWAPHPSIRQWMINARSETLLEKTGMRIVSN